MRHVERRNDAINGTTNVGASYARPCCIDAVEQTPRGGVADECSEVLWAYAWCLRCASPLTLMQASADAREFAIAHAEQWVVVPNLQLEHAFADGATIAKLKCIEE